MTTEVAGAELDVSPDSAGRFATEGLIRFTYKSRKLPNGRRRACLELNGRDVQTLRQVRAKHGVVNGLRLARKLGLGRALAAKVGS
jgi:hypothetical protein